MELVMSGAQRAEADIHERVYVYIQMFSSLPVPHPSLGNAIRAKPHTRLHKGSLWFHKHGWTAARVTTAVAYMANKFAISRIANIGC